MWLSRAEKIVGYPLALVLLAAAIWGVMQPAPAASQNASASCIEMEVVVDGVPEILQSAGCEDQEPTPAATSTATATATEAPPNPTPAPTETPTQTVSIAPYSGAPACPTHGDRAYHGVWDEQRGCHYDGSHGDDPHELDHVFGTAFYDWAGGEISYPWQTPDENLYKHGAYSWYVREYDTCVSQVEDGCIMALRAQAHAVGAAQGNTVSTHSAWLEALICAEADPTACSIVRGGGWQGPADLIIDDIRVLDRPGNVNRHFLTYYLTGQQSFGTWYNGTQGAIVSVAVQAEDKWNAAPPGEGCVVMDDGSVQCDTYYSTAEEVLAAAEWLCADGDGNLVTDDCRWNSSRRQLHVVTIGFRARFHDLFDADNDGYLDEFHGYTDRHGWPVSGCSAPGLDCVPLHIEPYPADGTGAPIDISYQRRSDAREYDYCFDDETGEPAPLNAGGACGNGRSWSGWFEFPIVSDEE